MSRSVLEDELSRKLAGWRAGLHAHDRGVLMGFMLSLVPIFPVPLLGLALGWFHLRAHRAGKLSDYDGDLVRRGVMVAVVNCVLSLALVWGIAHLAAGMDWMQIVTYVPRRLAEFVRWVFNLRMHGTGGTSV